MRALYIWIVWTSSNQITVLIISIFFFIFISTLIWTLIPLVIFGTFFSRIKMYTLFPLHHTTSFILLSHIRLLPLHSVSRSHLLRLFNCSMLRVSESRLLTKLSSGLLPHCGSLIWTQLLIEAASPVDLLGGGSGGRTAVGAPLLISQLRGWLRLIDNVFTFRDMTFSSNYKSFRVWKITWIVFSSTMRTLNVMIIIWLRHFVCHSPNLFIWSSLAFELL
jgi:hypothetical protein